MVKFSFSHEDFTTIINKAKNFYKLNKNIELVKSQRNNVEKYKLIKDVTKMGIIYMYIYIYIYIYTCI